MSMVPFIVDVAVDGRGVGDRHGLALEIGVEVEGQRLALQRAGEVGLAEGHRRVVAGDLFAVLLEGDGRRAGAGVGLDFEHPLAGDVQFLLRGHRRDDAATRARSREPISNLVICPAFRSVALAGPRRPCICITAGLKARPTSPLRLRMSRSSGRSGSAFDQAFSASANSVCAVRVSPLCSATRPSA